MEGNGIANSYRQRYGEAAFNKYVEEESQRDGNSEYGQNETEDYGDENQE